LKSRRAPRIDVIVTARPTKLIETPRGSSSSTGRMSAGTNDVVPGPASARSVCAVGTLAAEATSSFGDGPETKAP
jgi:hypothetical protein